MVMVYRVTLVALLLCLSFWVVRSKVYDRCELALEFRDIHKFPNDELATWLCIAYYESLFNTSAINPGSGYYGLFQISEEFWCSSSRSGLSCGVPCVAFQDDDLRDDVLCAKRIYERYKRVSGDGFTAWVVYNSHCKNPVRVASFLDGCFDNRNETTQTYSPTTSTTTPSALSTSFRFPKLSGKPFFPKTRPRYQKQPEENIQHASLRPPIKALNYRPLRAHVLAPVTLKPQIKAFTKYKPHNPTTKPPPTYNSFNQISIGPRLGGHRFSHISPISTTSRPTSFEQYGFSSLSTLETTKSPLFDYNNNGFDNINSFKTPNVKYVNPFDFGPNENIYAIVNSSEHSFAIGSNGFKLVWNGRT